MPNSPRPANGTPTNAKIWTSSSWKESTARTCGIYKNGGIRFKTDPQTGRRTKDVDNELIEAVDAYLAGRKVHGTTVVELNEVFSKRILVPTYFDKRYDENIHDVIKTNGTKAITLANCSTMKY